MIAPCTCGYLARRAKDPDVQVVECDGGDALGNGSIFAGKTISVAYAVLDKRPARRGKRR
jgi:hypothetical protein